MQYYVDSTWLENPDCTIDEAFRRAAQRHPDRVAIVDADESWTYSDLDILSNSLAFRLRGCQLPKEAVVGVLHEPRSDYIIACLAILKAGLAYLELPATADRELLVTLLKIAQPSLIITSWTLQATLHDTAIPFLSWSRDCLATAVGSDRLFDDRAACSTAFIGYSSGSTGTPKCMPVSHAAALYAYYHFWSFTESILPSNKFLYSTYLSWDAMSPLVVGATGYLLPYGSVTNPDEHITFIHANEINNTFLTPSLLRELLSCAQSANRLASMNSIRVLWIGGEVVDYGLVNLVSRLLPNATVINNYGPSECFVVGQSIIRPDGTDLDSRPVPVRLLPGMDAIVLDDSRSQRFNAVGSLYVTGPCLSSGYLNNQQATAERFFTISGTRYFSTGDLAVRLEDDRIALYGREAFPMKLTADGADLEAIRLTILEFFSLRDCVVTVCLNRLAAPEIVCFFVPSTESTQLCHKSCSRILSEVVPEEFIPSRFIAIEKLPINPVSRKMDLKLLLRLAAEQAII